MATFLFAWNPTRWEWKNLDTVVENVQSGTPIEERWSCGNTKKIKAGDRAFLIKLGQEAPKGIVASGIVLCEPYLSTHWDVQKAKQGKEALFVDIEWNVLLDPYNQPILNRDRLNNHQFVGMHWDIQRSGTQIPDEIAKQLESEWETTRIQSGGFRFPEEIEQTTYPEGAVQRVQVNRYERNPQARRQCIAHYGAQCQICDFDFAKTYGQIGEGFIHVHHRREISSLGQDYEVDPTTDLIPVCPNCHAIIHRRKPAYTIEEVRALLRQREISLNE